MDEDTLNQFKKICKKLRALIYSIKSPEMVLLDLDSTLLNTYGKQEGEGFNFHYSAHGYHPLLCYDGLTGDLLKAELRDCTVYTSNGVVKFMQPLLDEYLQDFGNKNVTFGHGGRHLKGTGLSTTDVNKAIANDVIKNNVAKGAFYSGRIKINGIEIEYRSYGVEKELINVGTYYPVE